MSERIFGTITLEQAIFQLILLLFAGLLGWIVKVIGSKYSDRLKEKRERLKLRDRKTVIKLEEDVNFRIEYGIEILILGLISIAQLFLLVMGTFILVVSGLAYRIIPKLVDDPEILSQFPSWLSFMFSNPFMLILISFFLITLFLTSRRAAHRLGILFGVKKYGKNITIGEKKQVKK